MGNTVATHELLGPPDPIYEIPSMSEWGACVDRDISGRVVRRTRVQFRQSEVDAVESALRLKGDLVSLISVGSEFARTIQEACDIPWGDSLKRRDLALDTINRTLVNLDTISEEVDDVEKKYFLSRELFMLNVIRSLMNRFRVKPMTTSLNNPSQPA